MSGVIIKLQRYEILMGANTGVMRMLASICSPQKNKVKNKDFGWHSDVEGACAEVAFAKYMRLYWDGSINTGKAPDVGGYQVRHSEPDGNSLIVRSSDSDDQVFVLVTGKAPTFTIRGYLFGREAKHDQYIRDPGDKYPAWFVPQDKLKPIEELKGEFKAAW